MPDAESSHCRSYSGKLFSAAQTLDFGPAAGPNQGGSLEFNLKSEHTMPTALNLEDVKLNYDPSQPQQRFRDAGLEAAFLAPAAQLPHAIPWPAGAAPVAAPLNPPPASTDDLSRFKGYDAVVVTWTSAEAAALATLLTPANPISTWYLYSHDVAQYIPLVTGGVAPFNDNTQDMARYYHTLALYFPCQIGKAKALLMKSGLHLAYDGPAIPVKKLMTQIAQTVQPKLFITTGTGGGIGSDVMLGDVVIAGQVRFDCKTQFKNEPWCNAVFTPSKLPAGALAAITPALTQPNASRIPNARATPKMWPPHPTPSSPPTSSPSTTPPTTTNCRGSDRHAIWAMPWSPAPSRESPISHGTPFATHPIPRSQTPPTASRPRAIKPRRSMLSTGASPRRQA